MNPKKGRGEANQDFSIILSFFFYKNERITSIITYLSNIKTSKIIDDDRMEPNFQPFENEQISESKL